ncbi:hypothetical protein ACFQ69_17625 [Streptomyces sp. NPDC056470]|uniref:hypothetical protein n=1 Tax=Streptomyces sp. NPDC056470 TaxID=3345831 RepID=UPI003695BD8B
MEQIRVVALSSAEDGRLPAGLRKQWAKLSLQVNARMHGDGLWDQARMAMHNFSLRTRMIEELGPDPGDSDWDAAAIASGIVSAVILTPEQARERLGYQVLDWIRLRQDAGSRAARPWCVRRLSGALPSRRREGRRGGRSPD